LQLLLILLKNLLFSKFNLLLVINLSLLLRLWLYILFFNKLDFGLFSLWLTFLLKKYLFLRAFFFNFINSFFLVLRFVLLYLIQILIYNLIHFLFLLWLRLFLNNLNISLANNSRLFFRIRSLFLMKFYIDRNIFCHSGEAFWNNSNFLWDPNLSLDHNFFISLNLSQFCLASNNRLWYNNILVNSLKHLLSVF
jgi:hypothetical protein